MCLPAADAVDDLVVAELVQLALALDHALTPGSDVSCDLYEIIE